MLIDWLNRSLVHELSCSFLFAVRVLDALVDFSRHIRRTPEVSYIIFYCLCTYSTLSIHIYEGFRMICDCAAISQMLQKSSQTC